ncbi:MAG: hypothetical protein PHV39_03110 [Methanomicrobium sp.]|nr:hypothetical protein [Methanomicrobium sp.]
MKDSLRRKSLTGLCLLILLLILTISGCIDSTNSEVNIDDINKAMTIAEDRLYSINWNTDNPGNIRAELLASETDFKNIFDLLSAMQPSSSDEAQRIYSLRALSCSYIDMIAAMMDLTNVIEHYNLADNYASLYENYNWKMEIMTADNALASARNNLYSAKYRISGVNMNMVPLDLQGEITKMKVQIDEMEITLNNLADEFASVLN